MTLIQVELEDAKALLDIAVTSMDWGSGFLDHDEVEALRKFSVQIGVDPMAATPDEWRSQYPHAWVPKEHARFDHSGRPRLPNGSPDFAWKAPRIEYIRCEWCVLPEADPIHESRGDTD